VTISASRLQQQDRLLRMERARKSSRESKSDGDAQAWKSTPAGKSTAAAILHAGTTPLDARRHLDTLPKSEALVLLFISFGDLRRQWTPSYRDSPQT
jgi:hypothetical protein